MVVKGLNRFIEKNYILKPFKLHDTCVIIDGSNLIRHLYRKVDSRFGGDYDEYATVIKKYFASFKKCNISPIVIIDGWQKPSDHQLKRFLDRQRRRQKNVFDMMRKGKCWSTILPINAYEVFKDILLEMGITCAQCDFKNDTHIATLGKYHECPIVSDDSEFYLYDLPCGFIRFTNISTRILTEEGENGSTRNFLDCQIYYVDSLLANFPLREKSILAIFSLLAGNDYSTHKDFNRFYYAIKIRLNSIFYDLLQWLGPQTLEQAIKQVLRFSPDERRNDIEAMIENSFEQYKLEGSNMVEILQGINSNIDQDIVSATKLVTPCGVPLPKEFVVAFHKGYIPSPMLEIITVHRNFLFPQIENFSNISSYHCSRYIRQVIYGIILQHDPNNSERHTTQCLKQIEEYDLINDSPLPTRVDFLMTLRSGEHVPMLTEIYQMAKEDLRDFIASVLGVDKNFFLDIPNQLHLLFGCISYWLSNCSPKPTKEFLSALLLCILYYQMKEIALEPNKTGLLSNLFQPIAMKIVENLKHHMKTSITNQASPFDLRIVHDYGQLQTCVLESVFLNRLANFPFEAPKVHESLTGSMLYNLTKELEMNSNSEAVISSLLGEDVVAVEIFNRCMNKFISKLPGDYFRSSFTEFARSATISNW